MKKLYSFILMTIMLCGIAYAQNPISMQSVSTYNAAFNPQLPDSVKKVLPYYGDLGVRRVFVADCDNDGKQEIISTDYTNGGRVHVLKLASDGKSLEVI
ncbi:MAG: hypothetical protein ACM3S2_20155, partial [Ignavibacteriales bacterium]